MEVFAAASLTLGALCWITALGLAIRPGQGVLLHITTWSKRLFYAGLVLFIVPLVVLGLYLLIP